MSKVGSFFKSILPLLVVLLLTLAVTIPMEIVYIIRNMDQTGGGFESIMQMVLSASSDTAFLQTTNLIYGIIALIIFTIWYQKVFVAPFRNKKKKPYPTGFSFHTIMAILFLAIGLQFVTTLVVNIVSGLRPEWMDSYTKLIETAGYADASTILIIYSVILAPIVEEIVFRGLTFRYARYALPFWLANIWQALLFGVMHMNLMQGIYAFVIGLFLGFICHRGRGIKYSIPVHIVFNIIGTMYSGLIDFATGLNFYLTIGAGIALTIFAVWLFYTDFIPAKVPRREPDEPIRRMPEYDD